MKINKVLPFLALILNRASLSDATVQWPTKSHRAVFFLNI